MFFFSPRSTLLWVPGKTRHNKVILHFSDKKYCNSMFVYQRRDLISRIILSVCFGAHTWQWSGVLLTLNSGIIYGSSWGPYGVPGIEPRLTTCKERALPTVLSVQPCFEKHNMTWHPQVTIKSKEMSVLKVVPEGMVLCWISLWVDKQIGTKEKRYTVSELEL